jgi:hypothetical protein
MIELLVRLAISMAVVMAVMGLAARLVRRRQEAGLGGGGFRGRRAGRGLGAGGPAIGPKTLGAKLGGVLGAPRPRRARPIPPVEVVYRRALAKGAAVAVVEATGKQFLLGVTEQSITLLAELTGPGNAAPLDPHAAAPTNVATPTSGPAPSAGPAPTSGAQAGTRAGGAQVSDLEIWDEFDDWQQADRMPASPPDAASSERQNAWKLTLDSLRERTIRR